MGARRRSYGNRSNVVFPKSGRAALRQIETPGLPALRWKRTSKGKPEPLGTRLRKYGLTPEEIYMQHAPEGTAPERLLFGWLKRHGFLFQFQQPVLGGRAPGGAVIDFVLFDKFPNIALRIMSYWHDSPEAKWADDIQRANLEELGLEVIDLWEGEINTVEKVDQKMREILFGAPKFGGAAPMVEVKCPYCNDSHCVYYNPEKYH